MNTYKILVVVAHPDDEIIGAGGTMARMVDEGHSVQVMYMTGGETSSGHKRINETVEVARKLGLEPPIHCELPDQQLCTYAQSSINNIISEMVGKVKPQIVYTHAREDLNIDHRIVHDSVMVACRPKMGCSVTELYLFCKSPWHFNEFGHFEPDTFINVTPYIDAKIEAMGLYRSEIAVTPHPMALEDIRKETEYNGSKFCLNNVEEFKQVFRLI